MGGQHQVVISTALFEKGLARFYRQFRVVIYPVLPVWIKALQGAMDEVATQHGTLTL